MTTATPKTSVVIAAYQASAYIRATLASVFAQTRRDFEVVLVNDGSPDPEQFEKQIEPYRDRITYLRQSNQGPSAARNAAIRSASGEFIAILDSDDLWFPDYLEKQLAILDRDPALDLIYCDALLGRDNLPCHSTYMQTYPSRGPVTLESLLQEDCSIISSCTIARRARLLEAGLFDETLRRSEDYDLWLRMLLRGARMTYQERVLAFHRIRAGSLSSDFDLMRAAQVRVYEKMASLPLPAPQKKLIARLTRKVQAEIAMDDFRESLQYRRKIAASNALRRARRLNGDWRLLGLEIAVRVAPIALKKFYEARRKRIRVQRGKKQQKLLRTIKIPESLLQLPGACLWVDPARVLKKDKDQDGHSRVPPA